MKVELHLFNYVTKTDLKNSTGVDTSQFAIDLQSLKPEVFKFDIDKVKKGPTNLNIVKSKMNKLNVDKLVLVPTDVAKLSDVVKMMLLKKIYIMLKLKILKIKYLILLTY